MSKAEATNQKIWAAIEAALKGQLGSRRVLHEALRQLGPVTYKHFIAGESSATALWTSRTGTRDRRAMLRIEHDPATCLSLPVPETVLEGGATLEGRQDGNVVLSRRKLAPVTACQLAWLQWGQWHIDSALDGIAHGRGTIVAPPVRLMLGLRWDSLAGWVDKSLLKVSAEILATRTRVKAKLPSAHVGVTRMFKYPRASRPLFEEVGVEALGRRLELLSACEELGRMIALWQTLSESARSGEGQ